MAGLLVFLCEICAGPAAYAAVLASEYTVVPNVTPGYAGNMSYVRFANLNATKSVTTSVRMIGNTTGADYGTAIVISPARSSPQLSARDLLAAAGGPALDPRDEFLTLYLQSSDFLSAVQHVYFNGDTGFFENMSVCGYENGLNYAPLSAAITNVHSSLLSANYPSTVQILNRRGAAATVRLGVYEAGTGTRLGIFEVQAAPNTAYTFSSIDIEKAVNYVPSPTGYHLNLIPEGDLGATSGIVLSHTVRNLRFLGTMLNLTTLCSIDH
ncbi:MAG: hypothetical protein K1X51_10770 [Rhodospirillaceae bacterium]|nr:hypothetical protein [Rhodospirillaceae bacterium]